MPEKGIGKVPTPEDRERSRYCMAGAILGVSIALSTVIMFVVPGLFTASDPESLGDGLIGLYLLLNPWYFLGMLVLLPVSLLLWHVGLGYIGYQIGKASYVALHTPALPPQASENHSSK